MFSLILVGELLAFAFVLIDHGLQSFRWLHFGAVSFLTQWIILVSAACLCPLRPWFRRQKGFIAGTISYSIVLAITGIFTLLGLWVSSDGVADKRYILIENLVIAAIFAGVVLRYFYLQQQLHNREQAELKSRIQALQSRIRPHFLFNSMNSIASLIDINPAAAEKMVIDLSQLFRVSLNESALVPIEEEITLCQQFISIEQMRLGSRLQVDWDIALPDDPQVRDGVIIPSLLIQPLVENAIYHGIQPLASGGIVNVRIDATAEQVRIQVHNPVAAGRPAHRQQSNGMALENIRHRLSAHFGETACMKFGEHPAQTRSAKSSEGGDIFSVDIKYSLSDTRQGSR